MRRRIRKKYVSRLHLADEPVLVRREDGRLVDITVVCKASMAVYDNLKPSNKLRLRQQSDAHGIGEELVEVFGYSVEQVEKLGWPIIPRLRKRQESF